jgi:hypothetical protein
MLSSNRPRRSLIIALCLIFFCMAKPAFAGEIRWVSFSGAPLSLKQVVLSEIKVPESDLNRMSFLTLSKSGHHSVYLINTRVGYEKQEGKTCGSAGCLFLAYIQEGDRYRKVLSSYFIDRVPDGYKFLRIGQEKLGYPCLQFTSLKTWGSVKPPVTKTFCFDGEKYRS